MKQSHRIFFAIPYDTASRQLYQAIAKRLRDHYPGLETVIGNEEIGPSPVYSNVASFRSQNSDLFVQFTREIRRADVFVADLTHNNPNVHVELGIALAANLNILRVTGRSLTELGFDIRNFETVQYGSEDFLYNKIVVYLDKYFEIKRAVLSPSSGPLFNSAPTERLLGSAGPQGLAIDRMNFPKMKDCSLSVDFEFSEVDTNDDWFGVYMRAAENPILGSLLVYVRKSGMLELAEYPGPIIRHGAERAIPNGISGKETLQIDLEGGRMAMTLGACTLEYGDLSVQSFGSTWMAVWHCAVRYGNVQAVSRDTINETQNQN